MLTSCGLDNIEITKTRGLYCRNVLSRYNHYFSHVQTPLHENHMIPQQEVHRACIPTHLNVRLCIFANHTILSPIYAVCMCNIVLLTILETKYLGVTLTHKLGMIWQLWALNIMPHVSPYSPGQRGLFAGQPSLPQTKWGDTGGNLPRKAIPGNEQPMESHLCDTLEFSSTVLLIYEDINSCQNMMTWSLPNLIMGWWPGLCRRYLKSTDGSRQNRSEASVLM